jgi:hypothetical protein
LTADQIRNIRKDTIDFYVGAGCMVLGPDGEPRLIADVVADAVGVVMADYVTVAAKEGP